MFNLFKKTKPSASDFEASCEAIKVVTGEITSSDFIHIKSLAKLAIPSIDLKYKNESEVDSKVQSAIIDKQSFLTTTISTLVARKETIRKSQYNALINIANSFGIPVTKIDTAIRDQVSKLSKVDRHQIIGL